MSRVTQVLCGEEILLPILKPTVRFPPPPRLHAMIPEALGNLNAPLSRQQAHRFRPSVHVRNHPRRQANGGKGQNITLWKTWPKF